LSKKLLNQCGQVECTTSLDLFFLVILQIKNGMFYYFGIKFIVVLLVYMLIASVVEGKIIDLTLSKR